MWRSTGSVCIETHTVVDIPPSVVDLLPYNALGMHMTAFDDLKCVRLIAYLGSDGQYFGDCTCVYVCVLGSA